MTQALRDAAQALVPYEAGLEEGESYDAEDVHDMLDEAHAHYESQLQQRAALSAPQPTADEPVARLYFVKDPKTGAIIRGDAPTADERVAELMRLADEYYFCNGETNSVAEHRAAVEQSARALLSASQEDAEHAAMYRWMKQHVRTGSIGFGDWWIDACGDDWDEQIRSAMKEKKA